MCPRYKTDADGKWEKVGKDGDWKNSKAMTGKDGKLWIVWKDGTLYSCNKDGSWEQVGAKGDSLDVAFLVSMGGYLWEIENNGTLWRTTTK